MAMYRAAAPVIFLGLICISSAASVDEAADKEQRYKEAMEIRGLHDATWRQQQEAVDLLASTVGFRLHSTAKELVRLQNLGKRFGSISSEGKPLESMPTVEVASDSHPAALRELAKALRDGYGVEPHQQLSVALFQRASELGDPEAQGQMGWRYSLGVHDPAAWDKDGIVQFGEADEEAALLHYYFAALNGDSYARMVMGYRHMYGLGVPKSCWTAATYYQQVAEQVTDLSTQANTLPLIERIRLNVQSGHGTKTDRQRELLQYYQYSADKGNVDAQTAVGQVLNYGTHGMQRDHAQALHYFQRAAGAGDHDAIAYLGHMHANGFGTPQDFKVAHKWLEQAAEHDSASAQYGLGYMYLNGLGVDEDHAQAFKYFSKASNQGSADASFYLGVMHQKGLSVRRKNAQKAFQYFSMASHANHLLAMYNVAMMQLAGRGTPKSCKPALSLLKQLAERGPAAASLQLGHEHFFRSQYSQSLLYYLESAEMGMELGQSNAAWLMHRAFVSPGGLAANITFNLIRQSAEQGNVASSLMMADSYLYGEGVEQDWVRSAAVYYEAYQERSAQAMFNLGFAHEFGMGVPRDLQLARRFYQMARHTQKDAAVAVYIAAAWLAVHEAWEAVLPYVPQQLQPMWQRAFTVQAPYTTVLGQWGDVLKGLLPTHALLMAEAGLGRVAEMLYLPDLMSMFFSDDSGEDGDSDLSDTTLLIGLVIVLIVVLRARQQRAAARVAQDPGRATGDAGGAAAANGHAAALPLAQQQPPAAAPGPPGQEEQEAVPGQ